MRRQRRGERARRIVVDEFTSLTPAQRQLLEQNVNRRVQVVRQHSKPTVIVIESERERL